MKRNRPSKRRLASVFLAGTALVLAGAAHATEVSISGTVNGGTLTISASADRFAGAIDSLTFRGVQYINSADHGRELQTATSYENLGECFNPTEAGRKADGTGQTSSSSLLGINNNNNILSTSTNMAFWLAPGESYPAGCGLSGLHSAQNTTVLSGHTVTKSVYLGKAGISNLIGYDVNLYVPEAHSTGAIEVVTGYMPPTFSKALTYDQGTHTLTPLSGGSGDRNTPVILTTADGSSAMAAVYPSPTDGGANLGRYYYNFFGGVVSKWSCVHGVPANSAGTTYSFSCPIAIGNVEEVLNALNVAPGATFFDALPVFRMLSGQRHLFTRSYSEGAGANYALEGTAFKLYSSTYGGAYFPLYRCYRPSTVDYYISSDSGCEGSGGINQVMVGYASPTNSAGTVPMYRAYKVVAGGQVDHISTTNMSEISSLGYTLEGLTAYVIP